ncbi:hemolysin family protein [Singulisphaera sp. Ch08]|uniref:Hemolysin family protein n=2 Tax=Singulisphaera sp. Ch08 TaxID=3120278 RepID=A0AAU7CJT0_9BACT
MVKRVIRDLDRYIAGTQVGITLASLALGWIGEPALAHLIEPLFAWFPVTLTVTLSHSVSVAIAFFLITLLHVVLGELVPKSVALQMPEKVAFVIARPMGVIVVILQPLIWSLNGIGNGILRAIGMEPAGEHHGVHSVEELEILVGQSHKAGVLDDLERRILQRTFRFSELTTGQVMIPRADMRALDFLKPVEDLLDEAANAAHTRLPVCEGSLDNIVGVIYIHELFSLTRRVETPTLADLRQICHPPFVVPEGVHLDALLDLFRERRTQIAIVVDEYGSTAGLVTFEDVIEEVTGEVQDALEPGEPPVQTLGDGTVLVRGSLRLDELNGLLGWDLEDDSVDTVAGMIMNRLGRIAKVGDRVELPYGTFRVAKMEKVRIMAVAVESRSKPGTSEPTDLG